MRETSSLRAPLWILDWASTVIARSFMQLHNPASAASFYRVVVIYDAEGLIGLSGERLY